MNKTIFHIDMNSYFATLEQQANPKLRGKPIAVSGRPHINSVIAAASIEAKKFGIKSGMGVWEAKKRCPWLIFIPGDPAKYISTSKKFIAIFKSYTPLVEVFSIDEAFLDVTPTLSSFWQVHKVHASRISNTSAGDSRVAALPRTTEDVALDIKRRIKIEIGETVTCSIGIAKNKLLAKLASEKKKPDGLTIVDDKNLDAILLSSKLDDFCGIGRRTLEHLQNMGICTVIQLRQTPAEYLTAAFGARGKEIFNMAFGIDDSSLIPDHQSPEAKSFSHSLTLPRETSDRKYIEAVLLYLAEKVARRMRSDNFCGRVVHCNGAQKALTFYTDNGREIFNVGRKLLPPLPVKALYVGVGDLRKKEFTDQSLLPEAQKEAKIISALDQANDHFGENAIFRAAVLPVFDRDKQVAGIRGHFRFQ